MKQGDMTPWGPAQIVEERAPGVVWVSTAGHGGFWVSAVVRKRWSQKFQAVVPFNGRVGWYEEDCDWAIVCLAMPELFNDRERVAAILTCERVGYLKHLLAPPQKFTIAYGSTAIGAFDVPVEGDPKP